MKELYLDAYKIRKVESSLLDLFGQGLVGGTIHTCVGQEFTGVALAPHLQEGDIVVSNHRCHGHYMAIYKDYEGLIAEILGKPNGVNKGFGGSQHIHRKGFYSSGIQGGMVPNAAGMALSKKLSKTNNITVSFIGDGTLGQGIIYETFNFISKHNIPQIIIIENNKYSQSTSQSETLAGTMKARAQAFDINYYHGETNSPEDLVKTVKDAVTFTRNECRPAIIEIETYRLNAHSKGDDDRDLDEVSHARDIDSLNLYLKTADNESKSLIQEFDDYIQDLIANTLNIDNSIVIEDKVISNEFSEKVINVNHSQTTIAKEQNKAMLDIFSNHSNALFIGEDVRDPYGGAFKISKGLTELAPDRVFNMPISEPLIAGVSLGAATEGRVVFCEIMFGDFLALAFDQILNHASKMKNMFGNEIYTPLVIRTPMGGGRGYGATHSQCIEKHFLGIPGLSSFMIHPRVNVHNFYTTLAKNIENPALVFEHKLLYSQNPTKKLPTDYSLSESTELYPYTRMNSGESDITVVAFGGTGVLLESFLDELTEEEVYLDIFYPLDMNSEYLTQQIAQSVLETKKILFIEEGTPGYSLSDHFLSQVTQIVSSQEKFISKQIHSKPIPIPASTYLEQQTLPQVSNIKEIIWELFDE